MKLHLLLLRRRHQFRRHLLLRRTFATKYTGRITSADPTGLALSVEISPPDLPLDPRGHPLPRRHLICRVTGIIRSPASPDPLLDLAEYLQTQTLTLTPAEASEILKSLPSPSQSLDFFRFCSTLPGFKHDCFTCNRILSILSKSGAEVESIMKVVEEMERDGVRGSISTVNILIGIVGAGEIEKCLELARKWGLRFNGCTYKCLLQAYLRSRGVEQAARVYEEMWRKGYKRDIFAYNMLIDALAKANKSISVGNTSEDFAALAAMDEEDPDVVRGDACTSVNSWVLNDEEVVIIDQLVGVWFNL